MPNETVFVLGAGGHGKVVIDALRTISQSVDVQLFDNSPDVETMMGIVVQEGYPWESSEAVTRVHIAVGSNQQRRRLTQLAMDRGLVFETVIHPTAYVGAGVSIGAGCFIGPQAVINTDAFVGPGTIVNSGAIVEHDCKIGAFSHIAPGAALAGSSVMGENCFLGSNAVLKEGIKVSPNVVIGATSYVNQNIFEEGTFIGSPAKSLNNK